MHLHEVCGNGEAYEDRIIKRHPAFLVLEREDGEAVSYTHLTLPTKLEV